MIMQGLPPRGGFEPNDGQFDPQVRYVARGAGTTLALTGTDVLMLLSRSQRPHADPRGPEAPLKTPEPRDMEQTMVRMRLVGARQPAGWTALEKLPGISNYFIGNDPSKGRDRVGICAGGRETSAISVGEL